MSSGSYMFVCIHSMTLHSYNPSSLFGPFAVEAFLTSGFGHTVESRGALDELCKCLGVLISSMSEGQVERDVLIYSKPPQLYIYHVFPCMANVT